MPRCNTRHHNNNNPMQHPFHLTKVTTLHVARLLACLVYIAGEYIFVTRAHPISSPFKALLGPIHALLHSNYHTIIIMCDVHSPTHNPPHIHIYNAQTQWNATRRSIRVLVWECICRYSAISRSPDCVHPRCRYGYWMAAQAQKYPNYAISSQSTECILKKFLELRRTCTFIDCNFQSHVQCEKWEKINCIRIEKRKHSDVIKNNMQLVQR